MPRYFRRPASDPGNNLRGLADKDASGEPLVFRDGASNPCWSVSGREDELMALGYLGLVELLLHEDKIQTRSLREHGR